MGVPRKQLHVPVLLGRRSSLQAPRAEPGAPREARKGEPTEAVRAREPVLGRPLRPAPSSGASACFWSREAGLCAWGLARLVLGVRPPAWARRPEQAQALAQHSVQPGDQALEPPGVPHCQPFPFNNILLVVIQENRKRNRGPPGVYHVTIDVCELEAQGAQGNGTM